MIRRSAVALSILASLASAAVAETAATNAAAVRSELRQRGVSWVAAGPVTRSDLEMVAELGADWIVQTPFGWQSSVASPVVRLVTSGHVLWGETDEGLEVTTRLARELGIKTLLKPHIWLTRSSGDEWRGQIAMRTDADWERWFASYRAFILHYAKPAQRLGIEALAVGTELHATAIAKPERWRRLIGEIRELYDGELTYAANWYREYEEIPFWDALDLIGVQAYFPLSDKSSPSSAELEDGWRTHKEALAQMSRRLGKPILFTEIGYRSVPTAATRPWEWPRRGETGAVDLELQSRAYEAFFRTFWSEEWFAGAYFWKWFPKHAASGGAGHRGFTPQNKPAEAVLRRWYAPAATSATTPR